MLSPDEGVGISVFVDSGVNVGGSGVDVGEGVTGVNVIEGTSVWVRVGVWKGVQVMLGV